MDSRLIYSTELGSLCPDCNKPKNSCICRQLKRALVPKASGGLRIRYETAGRKGKAVTLITNLSLNQDDLLALARKLKQQLGTGGSVKGSVIELQGDHREKVARALLKLGYFT